MVKRTTPQKQIDETAFPVRVWIFVPPRGFGVMMTPMHDWLDQHLGRSNYAVHSGGSSAGRDRIAAYFRRPADGQAFLDAFPGLELADGTILPGYYSPHR